ncbi:unnamed protein product [Ixodes persulcatus]
MSRSWNRTVAKLKSDLRFAQIVRLVIGHPSDNESIYTSNRTDFYHSFPSLLIVPSAFFKILSYEMFSIMYLFQTNFSHEILHTSLFSTKDYIKIHKFPYDKKVLNYIRSLCDMMPSTYVICFASLIHMYSPKARKNSTKFPRDLF